jgi:hypothetical protein
MPCVPYFGVRLNRIAVWAGVSVLGPAVPILRPQAAPPLFQLEIAPVLSQCITCHGPGQQMAGLTILHLLGPDHKRLTCRSNGCPMRLADVHGELIPQIVA